MEYYKINTNQMTDDNHTVCSILINTPITFAYESLW